MFRRIDFLLLGIALGLTFFGLAMIASVSVYESYQLTERLVSQGIRTEPTNSFYLWRSFLHVIFGMAALGIGMIIPYSLWSYAARPLFILTLILLISVLIPGIGANYGTARSWILFAGLLSFQPSEFLKLTLILYLAVWLQKREQFVSNLHEGFVPFAILLIISTGLVAVQPDLGSFLVLTAIASTMFFVGGGNITHLILGGSLAAAIGLPFILTTPYIRNRFKAFFFPNDPSITETIGFQIKQALIAIGSGGLFGAGYGKSVQKFGYLPEVQADTIFAAMAEELGFFRLLIILGMYTIFIVRGFHIAQTAPDRFGFLVATGITMWVAFQTLLNIAVNLSLFPLTGLTLPFISYGGSSLVSLLLAVGILLNISSYSRVETIAARRKRHVI
ncbi:cell division protein FtsW [Candidatus Peregrinibacteria bacterium]|nr:cell division protein FtsW [Candidatus Peregrinibacteria bacterium]